MRTGPDTAGVAVAASVINVGQRTLDLSRPSAAARLVAAASRRMPDWTLIVSPALTLAVMLWGITARPYWGDEADTVSAVSRTVPQLFRLLGRIDAVHGLYYLLLLPVAQVAGVGEVAMRLPSALSMAAAAAGVTAIGRRLASRRTGLWAGLVFAVLPTVTVQGQDARPYAMVTAAAVLASYLLIRTIADPRPAWFAAYGLSLVAVGYLQLFGLLLVPAHAVTVIALGRRGWPAQSQRPRAWGPGGGPGRALVLRWLLTITAVGAVVAPVAVLGWAQRAQIAWIPRPGWSDVGDVAGTLIAASVPATIVIALAGLLGLLAGPRVSRWLASPRVRPLTHWWLRSYRPDSALPWLAVPWLAAPPLLLFMASLVKPVYFSRYVTFCVPAVALLAGTGLAGMRWWARAGTLALILALLAPAQLAQRVPGGGMRMVSAFLAANERPGDAIVYPMSSIPPWYLAYPQGFAPLRDIGLSQTPAASARLFGLAVPVPVLEQREKSVQRIWIVPIKGSRNPAEYLAPGFRLAHTWELGGFQPVLLYTRAN